MTTTISKTMRRFAAGLLVLAALGVAACGSTASTSSTAAATPKTQPSSPAAAPSTTPSTTGFDEDRI